MRYLNKIIFINSADKSLKYAEVNLDGNVHFIGTQGVGKSTLLRAILFFYNADKQKLGIPREKKTYDEYYFPYQNSYIIYEVQAETGAFCVLSFKSQGRVAFRFFDSAYDKNFFIDQENKAYETWDKTRDAFGRNIGYTRIINSYEEYRNILYGNNKGLSNEFRKYALLESRQYQNIPRTIANVFLNAKLDAEFVKETIIKSLNEDEIKIDLTTYSQTHLKDFETNLNDIKKWTDKNRFGENQVEKQADNVATTYQALSFLEKKKTELAFHLGYALNIVKEKQPKLQEQLNTEELKLDKVKNKFKELDNVFDKKKAKTQEEIGTYTGKLKEIKTKREEYAARKIGHILERVGKRSALEIEKKNLSNEKEILTSRFLEIQQRYAALLKQLENQLKEFENGKESKKNKLNTDFLNFKDELNRQYELIYEDIRKQHQEELQVTHSNVKGIEKTITDNRIKRSEVRNRRFYETEIETRKNGILHLKSAIQKAENDIRQATEIRKNIEKEWALEETGIKEANNRKIERETEKKDKLNENIAGIGLKIENSKDSLYGWLNEHIPEWDKTIGKVIDEENVLFKPGLNPRKISNADVSFYGISIETNEINKKVKTVAHLEKEKEDFKTQIQLIQQRISQLDIESGNELDKLRKRFHPKMKEQKEIIQNCEYTQAQSNLKLEEAAVHLSEWKRKAETEQKTALGKIENDIVRLSEEKAQAEELVLKVEKSITKNIEVRKKEKESKIKTEQQKLADNFLQIDEQFLQERQDIIQKSETIKINQKEELDHKGADTKRIDEIDLKLLVIDKELNFIDENTSITERFKYDKEQLFDKEDEFKNRKNILDKNLATESEKHKQQQEKLIRQMGIHKAEIEGFEKVLSIYKNDLLAFENFVKTELYQTIEQFILAYTDEHSTDQTCSDLINELNKTDNTIVRRHIDLQEAVNKFTGNFQENNLFSFKVKFSEKTEYFEFAEMLKEFVDENKMLEYQRRVEERFAHIIHRIGKETGELISKEGEISQVIREINNDFVVRNFVGAIKSMELKTDKSANNIFQLLVEIKNFNDENAYNIGAQDLFSSKGQTSKNEKAISLLKQLIKEMAASKEKEIALSDSFELLFKIVENDNDTGWVEKLTNVGSEGTDVLVKAMINIMLLNVFKERAARKQKDDFRLHCMMDEIGKLHPNNVRGILKFANERNILLINSSPTSYNATDYRYTYLLAKDNKNITSVKRLIRKNLKLENTATT